MDWFIAPMLKFKPHIIEKYWQTLHMHDTLKYRLCNIDNPEWDDVQKMLNSHLGKHMYGIYSREREELISEFAFETFTGLAAQVHFSMHPENKTRYSITVADEATNQVLDTWKRYPDSCVPFLETIYGLTPVTNRVACIFVQKAGFKKIAILPHGIKDRGVVVDAMLTTKTRL